MSQCTFYVAVTVNAVSAAVTNCFGLAKQTRHRDVESQLCVLATRRTHRKLSLTRFLVNVSCYQLMLFGAVSLTAQDQLEPSLAPLTIDRIYKDNEFAEETVSVAWPKSPHDREAFLFKKQPSSDYDGYHDIVRVDAASGEEEIVVAASNLILPGKKKPLKIEEFQWNDASKLMLVYTNSKRVWRKKSRGDYYVFQPSTQSILKDQIGGNQCEPASTMFATFDASGKQVAFVQDNDLFVHNLETNDVIQLTETGSETIRNGWGDWAYEEEFLLRKAFKWRGSQHIAFWQFDTSDVASFPIIENFEKRYPTTKQFAYPKVGTQNARFRLGIAEVATGDVTWVSLPDETDFEYVPRVFWDEGSNSLSQTKPILYVQQLNRSQNRSRIVRIHFENDEHQVLVDLKDSAWIDVHDEVFWDTNNKRFTWISERDGWRQIYWVDAKSGRMTQVTSSQFDVIQLLGLDHDSERMYFIASPDNPTQRYLYSIDFDGGESRRDTPRSLEGWNQYDLSHSCKHAIHTHSKLGTPPIKNLVSLPEHKILSTICDNKKLSEKLATLSNVTSEFFRVEIEDGIALDGWCLRPPNFEPESNKKYPILIYVYGEPAGSTVVDRWRGKSGLFHRMIAEQGVVVASIDNRGTNVPRGRDFRKTVYRRLGTLGPDDQAAALRALIDERPYLDPNRVGIWGWSGGGSSTLHAMFRYPKLYKVGVSVAPVPDQRAYDTIYQERYMGLLESNGKGYEQGSPITHAEGLTGALLIIHGSADDNCHYQTTEQLIDKLVELNKAFSMMVYPGRTHSISEGKNTSRHLRKIIADFLLQRLTPQTR